VPDAASRHASGRVYEAQDGVAGHRFARTRFAHQAQYLPPAQRERHIVHRAQSAFATLEFSHEPVDLKHDIVHFLNLGFSTSRKWSPTRFMVTMVISSAIPG